MVSKHLQTEVELYREHIHFLNNILTNVYYLVLAHNCPISQEMRTAVEYEVSRVRSEQEILKDMVSKLGAKQGGST